MLQANRERDRERERERERERHGRRDRQEDMTLKLAVPKFANDPKNYCALHAVWNRAIFNCLKLTQKQY
jgi:hypothetical protein